VFELHPRVVGGIISGVEQLYASAGTSKEFTDLRPIAEILQGQIRALNLVLLRSFALRASLFDFSAKPHAALGIALPFLLNNSLKLPVGQWLSLIFARLAF